MSSHSEALERATELGTSRSALTVKCPPKQWVAGERIDGNCDGNASNQSRPQAHFGTRPRAGHAVGLGCPSHLKCGRSAVRPRP
jgi:hypothetical protein